MPRLTKEDRIIRQIIKEHGARPELEALLRTTKGFSAKQMGKVVEQAEKLAAGLAPVGGHRDPLADEQDPRALADAIRSHKRSA